MRIRTPSNQGSILVMYVCTYVRTCPSRLGMSLIKGIRHIIARKEGGAWKRTPQAVDVEARAGERRRMDAEVDGAGPSAMVVEKDVVGPSAMVVESDSVGLHGFTHG